MQTYIDNLPVGRATRLLGKSRTLVLPFGRGTVAIASLILVCVIGYIDFRTGYERSLSLFYLVPISLGTWFIGLIFGLTIATLSVVVWVVSDLAAGIPAVRVWNAGMALASYTAFTVVLYKLCTLLRELDQRVRDRTIALQREMAERERLDQEIAEVADRERRRLGQSLHDSVGQHLTGTALAAQVLREKLAGRSANEVADADKVVRYIEEGIDLTRNLARGFFSPELEADGLNVALQGLAENVSERFGVTCVFKGNDAVRVRDSITATQLYHIAQEATTNAVKHAQPRKIDIELAQKGQRLTLAVSDDGKGFPDKLPEPPGLGLRLMAHGAALIGGKFSVQRNRNGGTIVTCRLSAELPQNYETKEQQWNRPDAPGFYRRRSSVGS
jgi:signal transduction histidine kinase